MLHSCYRTSRTCLPRVCFIATALDLLLLLLFLTLGRYIMDLLEPVKLMVWKVVIERVTVIKFRMDNAACIIIIIIIIIILLLLFYYYYYIIIIYAFITYASSVMILNQWRWQIRQIIVCFLPYIIRCIFNAIVYCPGFNLSKLYGNYKTYSTHGVDNDASARPSNLSSATSDLDLWPPDTSQSCFMSLPRGPLVTIGIKAVHSSSKYHVLYPGRDVKTTKKDKNIYQMVSIVRQKIGNRCRGSLLTATEHTVAAASGDVYCVLWHKPVLLTLTDPRGWSWS